LEQTVGDKNRVNFALLLALLEGCQAAARPAQLEQGQDLVKAFVTDDRYRPKLVSFASSVSLNLLLAHSNE
jgi:hypothetical protein